MHSHRHELVPELFITALGDSVSFFLPPRWPLAASSLLSVSVDLPIPDISKQQNHTLHGPLRLASLTRHDVFKGRPRRNIYQYSMLFTAA